jgi:hypothetical protein
MVSPDNLFSKPASFLRKNLLKIELIALPFCALGFYLVRLRFEPGEAILSLSLVGLAIIYYLTAFRPIPDKNKFDEFYVKLTSWSLSVATIGVLFTLQHWPGGQVVSRMGLISIAIALFFLIIERTVIKKGHSFEKQDIVRLLIAFAIVISFSFSSFNKPYSGEQEEEMEMEEHHQPDSLQAIP